MTLPTLLAALTPILAVFIFLVILRMPAVRAMPISLLLTAAATLVDLAGFASDCTGLGV